MAKGQDKQKRDNTNKPKLTTKEKKAAKKAKRAGAPTSTIPKPPG